MGCVFNLIRNILAVIGLITVIIVLVIAGFAYYISRPSEIEGDMHEVEYSEDASTEFDSAWEDFSSGAIATITITEEQISSMITDEVGELGLPLDVKDVWINFEPGSVIVKIAIIGRAFGIPVDLHVSAEAELDVVQTDDTNVLRYRIISLGLPSQFEDLITDNIEDRFDIDLGVGTWNEYDLPDDWAFTLEDLTLVKVQDAIEGDEDVDAIYALKITAE